MPDENEPLDHESEGLEMCPMCDGTTSPAAQALRLIAQMTRGGLMDAFDRSRFAASALEALVARHGPLRPNAKEVAEAAWLLADEMLLRKPPK